MKTLLVNQTFYPDPVSTAQHLTDLAIALKNNGHEVTVLTSRRGYSEPHPTYLASEVYKGIHIIRVWPVSLGRRSNLLRAADAMLVNLAFFSKMLFLSRSDTIVALTSPPLVSFFACLVARLKRRQFVYWVMDMNPDEAIAMGWIRETYWLTKILKTCQRFVVQHSDRVIALDRFMKDRLMYKNSQFCKNDKGFNLEKKIVVVPPWSHDDLQVVEHEDNPFHMRNELKDKFVVMYSGNHSVCHPLNTVLEAARLLVKDHSIIFMFIGGGVRVQDVLEFKTKHGLENIIQMSYVPRSEIKFSLSAADLHLVVMGDNMAGIVHPCKVYGILALGKPFVYVGPSQSHIADLIQEGAVGYSVRHGEVGKLVEVIKKCQKEEKVELNRISFENRKIAERFSEKTLIPGMVSEILEVQG